jgi:hypothetical protein
MSDFGSGDDFDRARECYSSGWKTAPNDLRCTHPLRRSDAAPITAGATVQGHTRDEVWAQLIGALGMVGECALGTASARAPVARHRSRGPSR